MTRQKLVERVALARYSSPRQQRVRFTSKWPLSVQLHLNFRRLPLAAETEMLLLLLLLSVLPFPLKVLREKDGSLLKLLRFPPVIVI